MTAPRAVLIALTALLALPIARATQARAADDPPLPTVAEITHRLDNLYRSTASHGTMRMEVVTKHYSRSLELEAWTKGDDLALIVIRKPAREAGNASLKTKDGLWSYGKRSDRLLRIPPGLLSESWMGSHFTNDDLLRESSYAKDYVTTVARRTDDGVPRVVLTMVPKPDTAIVYSRLEYVLDADALLPVRLDFFDKKGVVRRMFFEDVGDLGGRRLPKTLRLVPSDAPTEHTTITYLEMRFDAPVPAGTFTPQGLRRATER